MTILYDERVDGALPSSDREALLRAEDDVAVRAILVTGAPPPEGGRPAFCVGGDTDALGGHAERGAYDDGLPAEGVAEPGYGVHAQFDHDFAYQFGLTKPVLAAINGPAAGVGLAVACYADLRIAVPGAKLTCAHGKLNLPAEYGLSWLLPRLIGLSPAMELLLSSRVFTTDEAHRLGLVHRIVPPEDLIEEAHAWLAQLCGSISRGALAASKHQAYLDQHRGVGDSVVDAQRRLEAGMRHPDFAEGVAALTERRSPNFG